MMERCGLCTGFLKLVSCALVVMLSPILSFSPTASAQGYTPRLAGHVKAFAFQQVVSPWLLDRVGSRLQLQITGGSADPAYYFAAVDFELDSRLFVDDQPIERGASFDVYPVELYIHAIKGPLELRIGQQFIFWGRTSWVTPTDVLTGWDYANMASEIEDYRLAPLAARLNWYLVDELMLDFVWIPVFRPNRIPMSAPEEMGSLPVIVGDSSLPEPKLENGEFGLRLSHSVSRWALDWALAVYRGYDKTPMIDVAPILAQPPAPPAPVALQWTREYAPLWMVGTDVAKAVGRLVFKAEAALKVTEDWEGDDPAVRNSRLEYVAGVDYAASTDLTLGVQYISRWLIHFDRASERSELATLYGSPPPFVEKRLFHEGSLRIDWRMTDDIGFQLLGLCNVTYRDFFALAFLHWDIADAFRAYLGTVAFGGERKVTPFGRQRDNSRVFLELKHAF